MKKLPTLIRNMRYARDSHYEWAVYFEQNPEVEKEYVNTKKWVGMMGAKRQRKWVKIYDDVIATLESMKK